MTAATHHGGTTSGAAIRQSAFCLESCPARRWYWWGFLFRNNDGLTLVMVAINSLTILWIAAPLFIKTVLIFCLGYGLARLLKLRYEDALPAP